MKASKENNYLYNKNLRNKARYLRRKGTKAEAYLWKFGLQNKIMGYKFLRQRPILDYIVDFMCTYLMLIIKVDGVTHLLEGAENRDMIRQKKLEEAGYTVLRIEDSAILTNMPWILSYLEQEIKRLAATKT